MLSHQAKCTEGLKHYYQDVLPGLRKKRARVTRLLALFAGADSLTLAELRDRHVMRRPRLETLQAELAALGLKPSPSLPFAAQVYFRARLQRALAELCLSPRRPPVRFVCRKMSPYRQQAALCALILLNVPRGAERVTLVELCSGLPRLTPRVLLQELRRMAVAPAVPGVYWAHELQEIADTWWARARGPRDLSPDVARLQRRLT